MAYEVVMPYHLHMPSYFLETFTEYPYLSGATRGMFMVGLEKIGRKYDYCHSLF